MSMKSLSLIKLQWFQYMHDKNFHHDVYIMPNMKRLGHLTNHLVKYTQGMPRPSTWVDMLACTLSIANTFNLSFTRMYNAVGYMVEDIQDVPFTFNDSTEILESEMKNVLQRIAKLVEGWDHIESIQYRQELEIVLPKLLSLICQRALKSDPELSLREFYSLYFARISSIQSNHMFCKYFYETMMKSSSYADVVEFFKPKPFPIHQPMIRTYPDKMEHTAPDNYDPCNPNTQRLAHQHPNVVLSSLTGAELDTLYKLAIHGPISSGDIPSMVGYSDLAKRSYATQNPSDQLYYITVTGMEYFKSHHWADGTGHDLINKAYKH